MTKEDITNLFSNLYKTTLKDNVEDMQKIIFTIAKMVTILESHGVITKEEGKVIMDMENIPQEVSNVKMN